MGPEGSGVIKRMAQLAAVGVVALGTTVAAPAQAGFSVVATEPTFRALVEGRELRRFGIRLQVHSDGRISGTGFGRSVTGDWNWRDRYFCRTLDWGSGSDPDNCQLVLRDGSTLRFISHQGQGDHADFRLR